MKATSGEHTVNVGFVTMGCPKNEADTNRMKALVKATGYEVVEGSADADVVIVNTCSFLTEATEESLGVIFDVLEDGSFKERGGKLIVAGCMPSRFGDELATSLTEAAGFLPADHEDEVVELISELIGVPAHPRSADSSSTDTSDIPLRISEGPSAYVKISDGCDRYCAFCAIPNIRGRYFSRSYHDIAAEVEQLVSGGTREIVLIGQDTSIWGSDFARDATSDGSLPGDLAGLMGALAQRFPTTWFRVMYVQPENLTDDLLDVMASHDNICSYLDMPLQHASARVLKEMNRRGSGEEFLQLVDHIRERVPGVALRTSVIAGFPGETQADAAELKRFLTDASFDYVGVFIYSQEDGTVAGERTDQVPLRTRKARAQKLRDLCDGIGFARAQENVGNTVDVLLESFEQDGDKVELIGRTMQQAPDVDGTVHLSKESGQIGDIVKVKLTDSFCYEYEGTVV